jgi:hypothetical protein
VPVALGRDRVRAPRTGLAQGMMDGVRTPGFLSPEAVEKAWVQGDLDRARGTTRRAELAGFGPTRNIHRHEGPREDQSPARAFTHS